MATKPLATPKIKLSKDQKHYLEILEHVDQDIAKKTAARDKAAGRIMRLQKELDTMEHTLGNLKHVKKATEDLLSSTPPPPQFEQIFKTVYEHHYHYHYPTQPVIWPTWPYWNPNPNPQPYYSGPYWWNTVTCEGQLNMGAVSNLVTTTAGCHGLPGTSVIAKGINLSDAQAGGFTFCNNNSQDAPALASSSFVVNAADLSSPSILSSGSVPTNSGINTVELSTSNMKITS